MFEDQRLIWQLKTGQQDALVRIFEKYRRYLLKIAHGLVTDASQAEDAVQDVFVSLIGARASLRVDGNLRGYLVRSLINRVVDVKRSRQASSLAGDEVARVDQDQPERWVVQNEEMVRVNGALAQLPDNQRMVITLRIRGDLRFREIARLEDVSINTVQSRYRYGLAKLRRLLDGEVEL